MVCWWSMKCPHCDTGIHDNTQASAQCNLGSEAWITRLQRCPQCQQPIVKLRSVRAQPNGQPTSNDVISEFIVYPRKASTRPLSAEVLDPYKQDFNEAVAVLSLSPKASAALSRRNLQAVLRNQAGTTAKRLVRSDRGSHLIRQITFAYCRWPSRRSKHRQFCGP